MNMDLGVLGTTMLAISRQLHEAEVDAKRTATEMVVKKAPRASGFDRFHRNKDGAVSMEELRRATRHTSITESSGGRSCL